MSSIRAGAEPRDRGGKRPAAGRAIVLPGESARWDNVVGTTLCALAGAYFLARGAGPLLSANGATTLTPAVSVIAGTMLLFASLALSARRKRELGAYALALVAGLAVMGVVLSKDAAAHHASVLEQDASSGIPALRFEPRAAVAL